MTAAVSNLSITIADGAKPSVSVADWTKDGHLWAIEPRPITIAQLRQVAAILGPDVVAGVEARLAGELARAEGSAARAQAALDRARQADADAISLRAQLDPQAEETCPVAADQGEEVAWRLQQGGPTDVTVVTDEREVAAAISGTIGWHVEPLFTGDQLDAAETTARVEGADDERLLMIAWLERIRADRIADNNLPELQNSTMKWLADELRSGTYR